VQRSSPRKRRRSSLSALFKTVTKKAGQEGGLISPNGIWILPADRLRRERLSAPLLRGGFLRESVRNLGKMRSFDLKQETICTTRGNNGTLGRAGSGLLTRRERGNKARRGGGKKGKNYTSKTRWKIDKEIMSQKCSNVVANQKKSIVSAAMIVCHIRLAGFKTPEEAYCPRVK